MANPITCLMRASFIKIWTPEIVKRKDKNGVETTSERFSIVGIIQPDQFETPEFQAMKKAFADAKALHFPNDKVVSSPFRKGVQVSDENPLGYDLERYPEYAGNVILTLSSVNRQPGVLSRAKVLLNPNEAQDRNQLYSGCFVRAGYTVFKYVADEGKKKGISFGLSSLMIIQDGEPLISRSDPYADFEKVAATVDTDNSQMFAKAGADPLSGI